VRATRFGYGPPYRFVPARTDGLVLDPRPGSSNPEGHAVSIVIYDDDDTYAEYEIVLTGEELGILYTGYMNTMDRIIRGDEWIPSRTIESEGPYGDAWAHDIDGVLIRTRKTG